jgi:fatty acid CoA ligase FadD36
VTSAASTPRVTCAFTDDLIIRGGSNIHPVTVEEAMLGHPAVAEVAVVGRPDTELGQEVVAFVVGRDGLDTNELLAYCRRRLAPHMVPVEVIVVDSLPRTTSGKVRKRALLDGTR